jgi:hypothetical protein
MIRYLLLLLLACSIVKSADWYVSPTGTGSGTLGSPGSLMVAVRHTNWAASITSNDTVWLRNGTYTNANESEFTTNVWYTGFATNVTITSAAYWSLQFRGESNAPVTWRSYPNEWAKIDGLWRFDAWLAGSGVLPDWHFFRDLEFYWTRKGINGDYAGGFADGGNVTNNNNQWVNCAIHDTSTTFLGYSAGHARGCIMWYMGQDPAFSHLFYGYSQKASGNICFGTSGYWTQGGPASMTSNIFVGAGSALVTPFVSGWKSSGSGNKIFNDNAIYNIDRGAGGLECTDIGCTNNYFVAEFNATFTGSSTGIVSIVSNKFLMHRSTETADIWGNYNTNGTWTVDYNNYFTKTGTVHIGRGPGQNSLFSSWTNTYYPFDINSSSSSNSLPTNEVRIFANQDEAKRANIAVYNWARSNTVAVPLTGVLTKGDNYQLYNGLDYLSGPIQTGTYNGTNISVPMTNLATASVLYALTEAQQLMVLSHPRSNWMAQPASFSPEFGAFVVRSVVPAYPVEVTSGRTAKRIAR